MQSIKDSLKSFFRNFPYILLLILLISLPVSLIQACIVDVRFEQSGIFEMKEDMSGALSKYMIYNLLSILLTSILTMLHIGVMLLRKCNFDGTPVNFRAIFEKSMVLLPRVWLPQILSGIIVGIGLIFFLLPGILLYYIFYMVPYAVVYTEEWGRRGLYVASRYPRKHGRKVVGMILFYFIYSIVLVAGTSLLMNLIPFTGKVYYILSAGVYCLQDLLSCIPVMIIGGFALSLPIELNNSAQSNEKGSQESV